MGRFRNWRWLVVLAGLQATCQGWAQPIRLREIAEVGGSAITLSDLLPNEASLALRRVSAAIVLGPSPNPGSIRVIEKSSIAHCLQSRPDLLSRLIVPDRMLVQRRAFHLTRGAMVDAIQRFLENRNTSIDLGTVQIEWDKEISSLTADPVLRVTRCEWDPPRKTLNLFMHTGNTVPVPEVMVQLHNLGGDPHFPLQSLATFSRAERGEVRHPLIAAGTRAWLTLAGAGMRLQIEVVALRSGMLGQRIGVRVVGGASVFEAEVTGPRSLGARLES